MLPFVLCTYVNNLILPIGNTIQQKRNVFFFIGLIFNIIESNVIYLVPIWWKLIMEE